MFPNQTTSGALEARRGRGASKTPPIPWIDSNTETKSRSHAAYASCYSRRPTDVEGTHPALSKELRQWLGILGVISGLGACAHQGQGQSATTPKYANRPAQQPPLVIPVAVPLEGGEDKEWWRRDDKARKREGEAEARNPSECRRRICANDAAIGYLPNLGSRNPDH